MIPDPEYVKVYRAGQSHVRTGEDAGEGVYVITPSGAVGLTAAEVASRLGLRDVKSVHARLNSGVLAGGEYREEGRQRWFQRLAAQSKDLSDDQPIRGSHPGSAAVTGPGGRQPETDTGASASDIVRLRERLDDAERDLEALRRSAQGRTRDLAIAVLDAHERLVQAVRHSLLPDTPQELARPPGRH